MSYRNWVFTFFYPTSEIEENIQKIGADECKYIIYGSEITKDGKPHLQGYIELNRCYREVGVKKLLDPVLGKKSPVHIEKAIEDRPRQKIYCSKGLQSKDEYDTLGINGPNYGKDARIYERTFKEFRGGQGKRNDWTEVYNKIKESPNFADVLDEFPEHCIKYPSGIQKAIDIVKNEHNKALLKEKLSKWKLFNWQIRLKNELEREPNDRKIIWYVDTVGNSGKTNFAKMLITTNECAYFSNAKCADIARAYNGERIALFDFTRTTEERINYSAIEQIKNGLIFSSKYDSTCKINNSPHVICIANFHPNEKALSADRWDIRYISAIDRQHPQGEQVSFYDKTSVDISTPKKADHESSDEICININTVDSTDSDDSTISSDCTTSSTDNESQSLDVAFGNTDSSESAESHRSDNIGGALDSPDDSDDEIYEKNINYLRTSSILRMPYKDSIFKSVRHDNKCQFKIEIEKPKNKDNITLNI